MGLWQLFRLHNTSRKPSSEFVKNDNSTINTQRRYYKYTQLMVNGVLTNPSAFPFGLQMISGDTFQRNFSGLPVPDSPQPWSGNDITQANLERKAVGFNCMNYQCPGGCDEPSLYRHFLPTKDYLTAHCPDGIRMELVFPQCWNGKDLDSVDHKSHVAYASDLLNGGTCPPGFDHVLPQLFYETYTYPQDFYSEDGQFVISNGDPTGKPYQLQTHTSSSKHTFTPSTYKPHEPFY